MKNLSIKLIGTVLTVLSCINVISGASIFNQSQVQIFSYVENYNPLEFYNQDEINLKLKTKDDNPNTLASMDIELVSPDGTQTLGIYTLVEGELLEITIDNRNLLINIINQTNGAELIYWFE